MNMNTIFLNQDGYMCASPKEASLLIPGTFHVFSENGQKVFAGETVASGFDEASGDTVYFADFSEVKEPGHYYLTDAEGNSSHSFIISDDVYEDLLKDLIKALYFQRCGCALEEKHAGIYKHGKCHAGITKILEEQEIAMDMCGGWHDAGDYGRYVTPGATTIGHILYAYLMFPGSFDQLLNIPESGNGVPDALNECRYELEWLLKLQREDGAVYHKVTGLHHAPFVMPEDDLDQFYAYPISSMATGDFAACMALSYRVYKPFDQVFAEKMLESAKKAYEWLIKNPEFTGFKNPEGTGTGEYGDRSDRDERLWAATELYVATGDEKYLKDLDVLMQENISMTQFGWGEVSGFASMCALTDPKKKIPEKYLEIFKEKVSEEAKRMAEVVETSGYHVAMPARGFFWGSNGVIGNRGILFILAGWLENNQKYYDYALDQLHYLLGRNALDYSYVTGHGEHAYMRPHLRPTEADGIEQPMAGWVSGGPNGGRSDQTAKELIPEGTPPMKCFVDDWRSYSTNEVTIYWNSPFVFLVSAFLKRAK